ATPDIYTRSYTTLFRSQPRTAWRNDRHHEGADRLDSPVSWVDPSDAGQDAGGDGGFRREPVLQCREPDAHPGTLDADDHHPEPRSEEHTSELQSRENLV